MTQVQVQSNESKGSTSSATMEAWTAASVMLDNVGAWSSTNTTRFVTPSWATRARFTVYPVWAANTTNFRYVLFQLNGSFLHNYRMRGTNETTWPLTSQWITGLKGGSDYFEVGFAQDSGGNLNLTGSSSVNGEATFVQIEWAP